MESSAENISIKEIKSLITTIKIFRGFDFSNYALSSFQRRIARILTINNLQSTEELEQKIKTDLRFYNLFLKEVTVNTTEMFRDPGMWNELRQLLQKEFETKTNLSIWHAGCSSGEEVYSMAIILKELGVLDKCKIVATDINEDVISNAKKGIYSSRNMEINRENYKIASGSGELNQYYKTEGVQTFMDTDLIKEVQFKLHNLAQHEAFGQFDIILCRNVMIYFDKFLQDQVFKLFYRSLNPFGLYIIGSKESLVWCSIANRFETVNEKEKIYIRKS